MQDPDNCLISRARGFIVKILVAAGQSGTSKDGLFPFRCGPNLFLAQLERGEPVSLSIVPMDAVEQLITSLRAAASGIDYDGQKIDYVSNPH